MTHRFPDRRWHIAPSQSDRVAQLVQATGFSPLLAQVMINRGIDTPELAQIYIEPESELLPSPLEEFPDLAKSVELLQEAIAQQEKIAICGDYDADGMTSTALLIRALRHLGADVSYAIPSRMKDGYGINERIVKEFASNGVGLILTVDNGIAAYDPVALAVDLGLTVIITDHHDLPPKLPPADAILNPKLIPESSPYRGLAGVGVAYVLAVTAAQSLGLLKGLTHPLLELFTLGTIADLAPLVGVNRRWLKRGLRRLPNSEILGVQALMEMAELGNSKKAVKPDDIGFRLGPRINAIGRIGDPQVVIELLSTSDRALARERAMQCEQTNKKRQELCEQIAFEAITLIENNENQAYNWKEDRVLVIVQPNWHHGVIGIVASRLVERYGAPVFIGTYEDEEQSVIRGSARGIPEFNVFEALHFCKDYLGKFGGHKAAGGFSFPAANLTAFQQQLSEFSHKCLEIEHLKPLINVDTRADFNQLNSQFYHQIDSLQPWGIGNPEPIFWTPNVRVLEQKVIGKKQSHLKLTLGQKIDGNLLTIKAIAWRYGEYFPLPQNLDIAYKLRENNWNGNVSIELTIEGIRLSATAKTPRRKAEFQYNGRSYLCNLIADSNELRIKNPQGQVLSAVLGRETGLLGTSRKDAKEVNLTVYSPVIQAAKEALGCDRL